RTRRRVPAHGAARRWGGSARDRARQAESGQGGTRPSGTHAGALSARLEEEVASRLYFVHRANDAYIEEQYARYRRDPRSVGEEWALFFAAFELAGRPIPVAAEGRAGLAAAGAPNEGVFGLIQHFRVFGH